MFYNRIELRNADSVLYSNGMVRLYVYIYRYVSLLKFYLKVICILGSTISFYLSLNYVSKN